MTQTAVLTGTQWKIDSTHSEIGHGLLRSDNDCLVDERARVLGLDFPKEASVGRKLDRAASVGTDAQTERARDPDLASEPALGDLLAKRLGHAWSRRRATPVLEVGPSRRVAESRPRATGRRWRSRP